MVWFFVTFATGLLIAVASSNVGTAVSTVAVAALEDAKTLALRCLIRAYAKYRLALDKTNNSDGAPVPMTGPSIDFSASEDQKPKPKPKAAPKVLRCYVDLTTTSFPVIPGPGASANAALTLSEPSSGNDDSGPVSLPAVLGAGDTEFTSLFHFALKDITKRANELQMMSPGEYVLAPCYEVRRLLGVDASCDVEVYFRDEDGRERAMTIAKLSDSLPEVIAHPLPLWSRPKHTPRVEVTRAVLRHPGCDDDFAIFDETRDELLKHCRRWLFAKPASREELEQAFSRVAPRILRDFMFATGGLDFWRDELRLNLAHPEKRRVVFKGQESTKSEAPTAHGEGAPVEDEDNEGEDEDEEAHGESVSAANVSSPEGLPIPLTLTAVCSFPSQSPSQWDCFSHTVFL